MSQPTLPLLPLERFIQSAEIKNAQQYLWEASLSHNFEDIINLRMAVINLEREIKNRLERQTSKRLKNADEACSQVLKNSYNLPDFQVKLHWKSED